MSTNPKIIQLNESETTQKHKLKSLPPILLSVRQSAKKELSKLLADLFNHTDDALFEMADRSADDQSQGMYFESMREIRLNRSQIIDDFINTFSKSFDNLNTASITEESTFSGITNLDDMELVDNDDLEVSVALHGMCSKITTMFSTPIMQLTQRIDAIFPDQSITEQQNPLSPQSLSEAFSSACEFLNIDFKIYIFILKLYEHIVLENLEHCYTQANNLLIEAGILPKLKATARLSKKTARAPGQRSDTIIPDRAISPGPVSGNASPAQSNTYTEHPRDEKYSGYTSDPSLAMPGFPMLQALLASNGMGAPSLSQSDPSVDAACTMQLLQTLSQAQSNIRNSTIDLSQLAEPSIRKVLEETQQPGDDEDKGVTAADNDAINLVGMLFDCILNDRNLAIPMKALISRLQIPFVKIAVIDKSFFTKTGHPARQLLNELSSAGIGWSNAKELRRDAVYSKIESTVLCVLDEFTDDISIIEDLVADLRKFLKKDKQRTDVLETRVKDAEQGKALTGDAKLNVQNLINQKASGLRLPQEIGKFISETWSKALVYILINESDQSDNWQEMVNTLDELLWAVQPLDEISDMERRERLLDRLGDQLANGIAFVEPNTSDIGKHTSNIIALIREISVNDRTLHDGGEVEDLPDIATMQEIILTPKEVQSDINDGPAPDPSFIEQINSLKEGSWVELLDENMRLKVATIIEPGGKYVFVNQRGMKVAEKSRMALAIALESNRLTILDESQVFDKALQSVIGNLRHMHRNNEPKPV